MGNSKHPLKIRFGLFTIEAESIGQCFALSSIVLAVYVSYSYINYFFWKKKHVAQKVTKSTDKPVHPFLANKHHEPEVMSLNQLGEVNCADLTPVMGRLFYAGDIVFLFSVANKGKTIAGIQMAMDLASGAKSTMTPSDDTSSLQRTIYFNFEMRKEQLKRRYFNSDEKTVYPDNLELVFCNGVFNSPNDMLDDLALRVEQANEDTTIFIDTITDICPSFFANESAKVIGSLRTIQENAKRNNGIRITFVLLGHAIKKNAWERIEMRDLSGSSNQANLADSVLAIGVTKFGKDVRYLKVLKARNDELNEKVFVEKTVATPYLHFEFNGEMEESEVLPLKPSNKKSELVLEHLPETTKATETSPKITPELLSKIKEMYQPGVPGHGYKAVLNKFGTSIGLKYPQQVKRLLETTS